MRAPTDRIFFANGKCLGSIDEARKSVFVDQDATAIVGDHVKLPEENPAERCVEGSWKAIPPLVHVCLPDSTS